MFMKTLSRDENCEAFKIHSYLRKSFSRIIGNKTVPFNTKIVVIELEVPLYLLNNNRQYVRLKTRMGPTIRPIPTTGPIPQMDLKSDVIP